MILVDANLLIYAYNTTSPEHEPARSWFESALSGRDPVRIPWTVLLAFLRISTNTRIFRSPMTPEEATSVVSEWFTRQTFGMIEPGERHWTILSNLIWGSQTRGDLMSDAHLAAIAIEHGATLCTADRDFTRFEGLSFRNPLAD